jgi:ankyrin repeat protein
LTPLHNAVEAGHVELVQLLIDNGARVDETNNRGLTLVDVALYAENKEIAELLVANGAKATFHQSAYIGDIDKTKSFVDSGIDINQRDEQQSTPLHYATKAGSLSQVKSLISNGANVNAKDKRGRRPLHHAAGGGHTGIVRLLIANGAKVDAGEEVGFTPLVWAAGEGHKDVVKLLLDSGADINGNDSNSNTALSEATLNGHRDIVELLLSKGADVTAGCMSKYVSIQDTEDKNFQELAEYLVSKYGPYKIIVADTESIRQLLRYCGTDFDDLWIPEKKDLEGLDDTLRSYLQNATAIKAKSHFSRKFILTYFDQYSREYSGITRGETKYIICQMIQPLDFPTKPPNNKFTQIHGFANGVVRVVFELKSKKVVEIDCEYIM